MTTRSLISLIIALALLAAGVFAFMSLRSVNETVTVVAPTSFAECATRYAVQESFPRRCVTPEGVSFVEEVTTTPAPQEPEPQPTVPAHADLIQIDTPSRGQTISSPLTVTGKARGPWYFEATFPVEVRNSAGAVIGQGYAEAQGEWMTESFVTFRGTITYTAQPAGSTGTVVFKNSNPSGDAIRDKQVVVPVTF